MIEINLEYDHKDGTTLVDTLYSNSNVMQMDIDGDIIKMKPAGGDITYQAHYDLFRDNRRRPFNSSGAVHRYMLVDNSIGYTASQLRDIPVGSKLYI